MTLAPKIIVALDVAEKQAAYELLDALQDTGVKLKIGNELFTRFGPDFVRECQQRNFSVFLDLKYHDIPNTVARAVRAAAELGVWMLNVHALGGEKMMRAAREAVEEVGNETLLIGVTVLTSLSSEEIDALGFQCSLEDLAMKLAAITQASGLAGVVCSPQEAMCLRQQCGENFLLVTPGIRPQPTDDDQTRVMTPAKAIEAGADYLVIGRPITQASDPREALQALERG